MTAADYSKRFVDMFDGFGKVATEEAEQKEEEPAKEGEEKEEPAKDGDEKKEEVAQQEEG